MIDMRVISGFLLLAASATSFLVVRAQLVPFVHGDSEVVPTLTNSIALGLAAVTAGAIGAFLLISEQYLAIIASVCLFLIAAPTVVGSTLDLTDYLSNNGYVGFGARIIIMFGNSVLLVGVGILVVIAVGSAIRLARSQRAAV